MKLSALKPADYNPRTISDEAMKGLSASIARYGLVQPIVLNQRSGNIVGGHMRVRALEAQGETEADVVLVDLSPSEERSLNIALNSEHLSGQFVQDDLDALLAELQADLPGAFEDLRLDQLLSDAFGATEGATEPDTVPPVPQEAMSQPGEMYVLGRHRLLCGDSTKLSDVGRLMDGEKATLFATDPPYLVDYTGADRPHDSGKDWSASYHEIEIRDAETFFRAVFDNAQAVCLANAAWYCWHAHKRAAVIERIWADLGVLNHQQIIWVKPTILHGFAFWCYRHEPCLMGWRKGHKPAHDGDNGPESSTVWEVDWEGKARVVGNEHPTQKPVELFARPMRKHTRPGDICFEPFCGSGSQIIAAEKTGRRCYALEIEPVFCDVIRRRWSEFTEGEECGWQALTPPVGA